MARSTHFIDHVAAQIDTTLKSQRLLLDQIDPELMPLLDQARALLHGGKRFRALLCYWGWRAVTGFTASPTPLIDVQEPEIDKDLPAIVSLAASLEIFHAAALIHDDIMDAADIRRGLPSAHRAFYGLHQKHDWHGNPNNFGTSAALLLGDLLFSWSDQLFGEGIALVGDNPIAGDARAEFARMRTEVTAGQYLDLLEEHSWRVRDESVALERAHRVVVYKSARYSTQAPLLIGAALGGATPDQRTALSEFGLPLGVAFQLRDDLLGVFGDSAVTGKPSGDDLRQGKRTVLIGLTRRKLPPTVARVLDELLGDPTLDDDQIAMLQNTVRECGAAEQVETIITRQLANATNALQGAQLAVSAKKELLLLADRIAHRTN